MWICTRTGLATIDKYCPVTCLQKNLVHIFYHKHAQTIVCLSRNVTGQFPLVRCHLMMSVKTVNKEVRMILRLHKQNVLFVNIYLQLLVLQRNCLHICIIQHTRIHV